MYINRIFDVYLLKYESQTVNGEASPIIEGGPVSVHVWNPLGTVPVLSREVRTDHSTWMCEHEVLNDEIKIICRGEQFLSAESLILSSKIPGCLWTYGRGTCEWFWWHTNRGRATRGVPVCCWSPPMVAVVASHWTEHAKVNFTWY